MRTRFWISALLCALPIGAANRVSVTVVDAKSGKPALGLKADEFTLYEDKLARKADAAEFSSDIVDVMLLFDTSLVGEAVRPVADDFVAQLKPKEQMAIVAFHSSADLIQDFTSSKPLLARAIGSVTYGNTPRVLDALYAAIDTGMKNATFRRVVVILTTGYEGDSRMSERDVAQLARKSGGHEARLAYCGNVIIEHRNGLVVDTELLQANGAYARLYAAQFAEAVAEVG